MPAKPWTTRLLKNMGVGAWCLGMAARHVIPSRIYLQGLHSLAI